MMMMVSNEGRGGAMIDLLPEGCIANVVSLTSPGDACRLSLVASLFRSAAESDGVWETFLPSDYMDIIGRAVDPTPSSPWSKKQLYLWLSDNSLVIDNGTKSFSLEKWSGKKCYMLAARDLSIVWGDTPQYWKWTSLSESRFSEVAELISVCWLEIHGKIKTSMLSPNTTYAAYLVFKSTEEAYGFEYQPAEVTVGITGGESETQTVYLDPDTGHRQQFQIIPRPGGMFNRIRTRMLRPFASISRQSDSRYPKARGDGWMEIQLGEYFNKDGEDGELEMSLREVRGGNWKSGLIVHGIDIRPKENK
ncbi:F-box protein PP2-B1 [Camellia lanceoleosa]|uniref:F-box protein PP2-B1 n=1 Tax=Camellia lanceoleosa TaxID=1840588 RepID=A0ACC0J650_9ERIC|nr:F-box protein PP2-B1 [Camellia lanceoleosa]